ncbi:Wzz/FepE/Etk N-terminal domain-containing protein [Thermodesulfovibrio yellowstonii]|uniref:Wzz/FepE/Etk N-terminal domain-containing protein n=1 Tax=Thermodesulfovibrio yellowstonii TaxID=28262 RepID=UPI0004140B73|nr:Wzz/FepE/Etk N-terminal domain-containing protein [Thermodesulfovibrio islandicus]
MNEQGRKEQYSDEIDLYELLLVLKKRLKLIVAVSFIGLLIGGLVAFLSPDIYQARATLWVDSLIGQSVIERFKTSDSKTSFIIPLGQTKSPEVNNLSLSILNSLEFKKKVVSRLIQQYGDKEDILSLTKSINSGKGEVLFKAEIDKKTGSINLISEQRNRKLAEDILKIVIDEFEKELDNTSQIYSKAISTKTENIKNSKNFVLSVIEQPTSLESPVKPKRKLIIAVAGISALFSGIFLAFVVEWWSNVRARRKN